MGVFTICFILLIVTPQHQQQAYHLGIGFAKEQCEKQNTTMTSLEWANDKPNDYSVKINCAIQKMQHVDGTKYMINYE